MSTTQLTSSDINKKSFYKVLNHEVEKALYNHPKYGRLNIHELKQAECDPVKLFNIVRDHLADNEELNQALAHLKVTARQPVEFDAGGSTWHTNADLMYFDWMLMESLVFTEREKLVVFSEELRGYGRYVHSEEFKLNVNREEEIETLRRAI